MRFDATLPTGALIVLDPDPTAGAPGAKPSELLLTALAGCTGMDVISISRKKRVNVSSYEVEVRGEQRESHPRTWTTIEIEHRFTGEHIDDDAVARAIYLSAARYCIVSAHLSAGDTTLRHRYRIDDAGGTRSAEVLVTGPYGAGLEPRPPRESISIA